VPITPETLSDDAQEVIRRHPSPARRPVLPAHPDLTVAELLIICEEHRWAAARVAEVLGIGRATLWRCLKRLGLSLRKEKIWWPWRERARTKGPRHDRGVKQSATICDFLNAPRR
jgi:regulatory Fis family protein